MKNYKIGSSYFLIAFVVVMVVSILLVGGFVMFRGGLKENLSELAKCDVSGVRGIVVKNMIPGTDGAPRAGELWCVDKKVAISDSYSQAYESCSSRGDGATLLPENVWESAAKLDSAHPDELFSWSISRPDGKFYVGEWVDGRDRRISDYTGRPAAWHSLCGPFNGKGCGNSLVQRFEDGAPESSVARPVYRKFSLDSYQRVASDGDVSGIGFRCGLKLPEAPQTTDNNDVLYGEGGKILDFPPESFISYTVTGAESVSETRKAPFREACHDLQRVLPSSGFGCGFSDNDESGKLEFVFDFMVKDYDAGKKVYEWSNQTGTTGQYATWQSRTSDDFWYSSRVDPENPLRPNFTSTCKFNIDQKIYFWTDRHPKSFMNYDAYNYTGTFECKNLVKVTKRTKNTAPVADVNNAINIKGEFSRFMLVPNYD